jgi:hypothetical protein
VPLKAVVQDPFGTPTAVHGAKVTEPLALTVYVPSAFVKVVPVQFGDTCDPVHSFTLDGDSAVDGSEVSLPRMAIVCETPNAPVDVLFEAVGAATTVGVYVEETVRGVERLSETW